MKVSGFLRGQPLSVNSLIHIPGWGDFQMEQIDLASNDFIKSFTGKEIETTVLETANPKLQVCCTNNKHAFLNVYFKDCLIYRILWLVKINPIQWMVNKLGLQMKK